MVSLHFTIMNPRTLGERLREARLRVHLTQDQLASRCGISRSLVSQWETGVVQDISAANLVRAARALRVSLDWLLEGDGDGIGEQPAGYAPDPELAELWDALTESQRGALLEKIRALVAHNRELLEQLTGRR
jgi:transcriptional regulator with XRE-family HTH domain